MQFCLKLLAIAVRNYSPVMRFFVAEITRQQAKMRQGKHHPDMERDPFCYGFASHLGFVEGLQELSSSFECTSYGVASEVARARAPEDPQKISD